MVAPLKQVIGSRSRLIYPDELNGTPCMEPGCTNCGADGHEMYIKGKCHPDAPVIAMYIPGTQSIVISCAECDEHIIELPIATRPE